MSNTNGIPDVIDENGIIDESDRPSADQMDEERRQAMAYEYLCRLEEARRWIGECLNEELPPSMELEESLRNGVLLARLANFFSKETVPKSRIFDSNESRYKTYGLHFRHTDNTVQWLRAMGHLRLPEVFFPDTTDVYDKKNMPKAVFCLHALSLYLYRLGLAPPIRDVGGNAAFTKEEIAMVADALEEQGIKLPPFSKIDGMLAENLSENDKEVHLAVLAVNEAIDGDDTAAVMSALEAARIGQLRSGRSDDYHRRLRDDKQTKIAAAASADSDDLYDRMLTHAQIQRCVLDLNESVVLGQLDTKLDDESASCDDVIILLQDPALAMLPCRSDAANIYYQELVDARRSKGAPLDKHEIEAIVLRVNALVAVNDAVDSNDPDRVVRSLMDGALVLENVREEPRYLGVLSEKKHAKEKAGDGKYLTRTELQDGVDQANLPQSLEEKQAQALRNLYEALNSGDGARIWAALKDNQLALRNVDDRHVPLYVDRITRSLQQPLANGEVRKLTMDEVQDVVSLANAEVADAVDRSEAVVAVNRSLDSTPDAMKQLKLNADRLLLAYRNEVSMRYVFEITAARSAKREAAKSYHQEAGDVPLPNGDDDGKRTQRWVTVDLQYGIVMYVNVVDETEYVRFERPPPAQIYLDYVTDREMKDLVDEANADFDCYYGSREPEVQKVQRQIRQWLTRKRTAHSAKADEERRKREDAAARKIQNFFRRQQSAKDYQVFTQSDEPTLRVVRLFATLLQRTEVDYEEELELEKSKSRIAKLVRSNRKLEDDLGVMDMKIGLLVKNRLGLEEVIRHGQRIAKERSSGSIGGRRSSLEHQPVAPLRRTAIARANAPRLSAYQHLLYHLQTEPKCLSTLLLTVSASSAAGLQRLVESALLPLFNFAAQQREEYLACRLFRRAVADELTLRVTTFPPLAAANALILPPIVSSLAKHVGGEQSLSDTFGELIKQLLADRNEHLNTNPVEIYRCLVGDPPDGELAENEAATAPEVQRVLAESMAYLGRWAATFLDAIVEHRNTVPYMVRYLGKVVKHELQQRFAEANERDLLKAVGEVLYGEYLMPALLTPTVGQQNLSLDDRKKLASIAKLLHFGVLNRGFGEENSYLAPLNPVIKTFNEKFRNYFAVLCDVAEPEQEFDVDKYSDFASWKKPSVFFTIGDLLYFHQTLIEHRAKIAQQEDVFQELLDDVGVVPTFEQLCGKMGVNEDEASQTQITLFLEPKPSTIVVDERDENEKLFLRTKKLVCDLLLCHSGDTIRSMLDRSCTDDEEVAYQKLLADAKQRQRSDSDIEGKTLEATKAIICSNLDALEEKELTARSDDYQTIVSAIAQDIRRERGLRDRRRNEAHRLKETLSRVEAKRRHLDEQADCYGKYIDGCLRNLGPKIKRRSLAIDDSPQGDSWPSKSFKYNGEKMLKKGLLLDVANLPSKQLSKCSFEIRSSTQSPGVFELGAKLAGAAEPLTTEVRFQDVLQLQYEGTPTFTPLTGVKLSVDEFIYFVNRKFYSS